MSMNIKSCYFRWSHTGETSVSGYYELGSKELPLSDYVNVTAKIYLSDSYDRRKWSYTSHLDLTFTNNDTYTKSIKFSISCHSFKQGSGFEGIQCFGKAERQVLTVDAKKSTDLATLYFESTCSYSSLNEIIVQIEEVKEVAKETKSLNLCEHDFTRMYEDKFYKDVKFVIGEESVQAHKFVLVASSDVFYAMFQSDTIEGNKGIIQIEDTSMEAFKSFLEYLYTNKLPDTIELIDDLMVMADKYNVQSLKFKCEKRISGILDENNSVDYLIKAHLLHCDYLKKTALLSTKFHMKKIVEKTGSENLIPYPEILLELAHLHGDDDASMSAKRLRLY